MKTTAKILFSTCILWSNLAIAAPPVSIPDNIDREGLAQQARSITQQYGSTLSQTLKATIMTSGPAAAIQTCKVHAPEASQQMQEITGWQVRRTSNKVRNPNNRPDLWEVGVLDQFKNRAEKGEPLQKLEHFDVVMEKGTPVFRYMKAISVKNICLNCHGSHVSGPVKEAINNLFPLDQATGYRKGELRGAFTLKKSL
ncbi:MAG: DUF3365 domain-containing protein [Pseudomonadales bacterium]|nr:DUF3365 domain-containing protein [Pseudomonadales bacterium]